MAAATAPPTGDGLPPPPSRRAGRVVVVGVVLALLAMWGYIFVYHLSGQWRDETPGRLEDPAFGAAAEEVCADALERIDQLPPAFSASDAAERARVVATSNEILDDMIDQLEGLVPSAGAGRPAVEEWLDDWRTYVEDRRDFARRLAEDPDARFYVTQSDRDNRQITQAIDRFANINGMPSCLALNDLA